MCLAAHSEPGLFAQKALMVTVVPHSNNDGDLSPLMSVSISAALVVGDGRQLFSAQYLW
jgi:hypothetical protein